MYHVRGRRLFSLWSVSLVDASGCDAADFAGFPAGTVALIQRGGCLLSLKATSPFSAGANGAPIFNALGAANPIGAGTLGESFSPNIPVMGLSHDLGVQFASMPGLIVRTVVYEVPGVPEPPQPGSLGPRGRIQAGVVGCIFAGMTDLERSTLTYWTLVQRMSASLRSSHTLSLARSTYSGRHRNGPA